MKQKKFKNKEPKNRILLPLSLVLILVSLSLIAFIVFAIFYSDNNETESIPIQSSSISEVSSKETIIEEPEFVETFATVMNTGDIMVHDPQLTGAYVSKEKGYDFSDFFKAITPYFKSADLAIANLEVTFGGEKAGSYRGYPAFNCPDSLATAIKKSGLDIVLTANNHSYDTGYSGFIRTQEVLKKNKIKYLGTTTTDTAKKYIVKEINNIKIGMADFTYETSGKLSDRKYLNGILLSQDANELITSFSYDDLKGFYKNAKEIISSMKEDGAEYIVFYMHWGDEYKTSPNSWQKQIAQELSNIGVDMIIGGHPHVIQPMDIIHSENGQNTTVCIYSLGNAVSNQRRERMDSCPSGHTEDGLLFTYTLIKTEDGVSLHEIEITPTWVDKYLKGNKYKYTIYPIKSKKAIYKLNLTDNSTQKAIDSYNRTTKLLKESLAMCQDELGCKVAFK